MATKLEVETKQPKTKIKMSCRELYFTAINIAEKLAGYPTEDRQTILSKVTDILAVLPCPSR